MGRPLNKKYFGNRNVGADGSIATGDTLTAGAAIGGQGVASFNLTGQGSYRIDNTHAIPSIAVANPSMADGVTATFSIVWEVDSLTVINGTTGQGYSNGAATLSGLTSSTSVPFTFAITATGSGVHEPQGFNVTSRGEWVGTPPTTNSSYAVVQAGSNGAAQVGVYYRIKSISVVANGSGYDTAPAVTGLNTGTVGSAAVITTNLTVDTGAVGSVTNRENAIKAYAFTGGNLVEVDIQKQISTKRYRVNANGEEARTGAEVARIRYDAVADGTAGYTAVQGVELNIIAVDSDGGTYLVRKLWNRTCTVNPVDIGSTPGTLFGLGGAKSAGTQFAAGAKVPWTFDSATANTTVQILNA